MTSCSKCTKVFLYQINADWLILLTHIKSLASCCTLGWKQELPHPLVCFLFDQFLVVTEKDNLTQVVDVHNEFTDRFHILNHRALYTYQVNLL